MLRYAISDRHLLTPTHTTALPATPVIVSEAENPCISPPPASPVVPTPNTGLLLQQAHRLALTRVNFFLLREPDLAPRDLLPLAHAIVDLFHQIHAPTRLLLHSRPDLALAAGAHGVHLSSAPEQLSPSHIRHLFRAAGRPAPTISRSTHTLHSITDAIRDPPDLLLFGPVFEKRVRGHLVHPGIGLPLLQQACQLAQPIPVLALGGLTPTNTPATLAAGAAGTAGIRLFL